MTLVVLAERQTDRLCEEHGVPIVEVLVRSDQLKNDWVLGVCSQCQSEIAQRQAVDDHPSTGSGGS